MATKAVSGSATWMRVRPLAGSDAAGRPRRRPGSRAARERACRPRRKVMSPAWASLEGTGGLDDDVAVADELCPGPGPPAAGR